MPHGKSWVDCQGCGRRFVEGEGVYEAVTMKRARNEMATRRPYGTTRRYGVFCLRCIEIVEGAIVRALEVSREAQP